MSRARVKPKRIGIIGDAPGGNYLRAVVELLAASEIEPGSMADVGVFHDDWCGIYHGAPCNCEPDIRLVWRDPS